jgi:hypothetical protein
MRRNRCASGDERQASVLFPRNASSNNWTFAKSSSPSVYLFLKGIVLCLQLVSKPVLSVTL